MNADLAYCIGARSPVVEGGIEHLCSIVGDDAEDVVPVDVNRGRGNAYTHCDGPVEREALPHLTDEHVDRIDQQRAIKERVLC